jgi:hypothetical protein
LVTAGDAYYWAGGRKIALRRSDQTAIDLAAAASSGLSEEHIERLSKTGRSGGSTLRIVSTSELPESVRSGLDASGALQPVYEAGDGSQIIVLPEVRVETTDRSKARKLDQLASDFDAAITEPREGRYVITPLSRRGADALDLANRVTEQVGPEVAQARFVRVVPRPGSHRRHSA